MASILTQIISFSVAKEVTHGALANTAKAALNGVQNKFLGTGVENTETRYWFIEHDTTSTPTDPNTIIPKSESNLLKNLTFTLHRQPLTPILSAPITEIIHATVKPTTDLKAFGEITDYACKVSEDHWGCTGSAWGFSKEDEREVILVLGWESIEAHMDFETTDICKTTSVPFRAGITTASMSHYKFQKE